MVNTLASPIIQVNIGQIKSLKVLQNQFLDLIPDQTKLCLIKVGFYFFFLMGATTSKESYTFSNEQRL